MLRLEGSQVTLLLLPDEARSDRKYVGPPSLSFPQASSKLREQTLSPRPLILEPLAFLLNLSERCRCVSGWVVKLINSGAQAVLQA